VIDFQYSINCERRCGEEQMRILLAGPDYEENLSIRYLSASLLNAGHETVLAVFNSPDDIESVAGAAEGVDIVGLSMCFQSRAEEFLRLARIIKKRNPEKLIVVGGHYASCAAEPLLQNHPEIDIVVIHEGERTLVEIVDALSSLEQRLPQISGIAYRAGQNVHFTSMRPILDDLDSLPFPDRRGPIHLIGGVPTSYLMGSRGCFGSCAYCCITTLHRMAPGKRFRQRNPERITDEMAALYHKAGIRQFVFHDDNFLVPSEAMNHTRIAAFEKALKGRGIEDIALVIKCRPADASEDILRRLKRLGLVRVFLGIESSTAQGLSALERKQSVEDSERALEACRMLDISAQFTLMIFNPDATLDTLQSDVAFMRRFCRNPLNFCRAEIYAGTPLEKKMVALGRARGNYLARVYALSDSVADLACSISLDLFYSRCWSGGSLMQNAIGLDHMASVVKRFSNGSRQLNHCRQVTEWLRTVNLNTIDLLGEIVELSRSAGGRRDAGLDKAIYKIREREERSRQKLLAEGLNLRSQLQAFCLIHKVSQGNRISTSHHRFAKPAAAAMLAIGVSVASGYAQETRPAAKKPPTVSTANQKQLCLLDGVITDYGGMPIWGASITVTNLDTRKVYKLKTNKAGKYIVNDLPAGRYAVKVEFEGYQTAVKKGIRLQAGSNVHTDLSLEFKPNIGVSEYAAPPLEIILPPDPESEK
jgi:anaerobic magnesium-protoporphyrin IX monomethyl ester cyclase